MRRTLTALAGLALAAPLAAAPAQAGIAGPSGSTVEASRLMTPLSLDVTKTGTAWFSQNFTGTLMRQRAGQQPKVAWRSRKGAEVGAVTAQGPGVTFATTSQKGRTVLRVLQPGKGAAVLGRLSRFEQRRNPDAGQTYGITDLSEGCTVPQRMREYTGIVESHPYATTFRQGKRYVADAAANAILGVSSEGRVSTVAVLPPQVVEITEDVRAANELPECAVGAQVALEAVPTDVEFGPDGMLYVTSLPGELLQAGSGQVLRVDPDTGDVETVAEGLVSATGLAVAPTGEMFVAELFVNRISRVSPGGSVQPWTNTSMPGDLEYAGGAVWATRKVMTGLSGDKPAGQVVRFDGGVVTPVRG